MKKVKVALWAKARNWKGRIGGWDVKVVKRGFTTFVSIGDQ